MTQDKEFNFFFLSTGSQPPSNNPADFLDLNFDTDGDTDNDALQLLSDMSASELLSYLDPSGSNNPLGSNVGGLSSTGSSFPNSTGNASDSGISVVSASSASGSAGANSSSSSSSTDDLLGLFDT